MSTEPPTVLVVDDAVDFRDTTAALLRAWGYRAEGARDGRAALAWLRNNPPPGLILLDLRMPGMDGVQFRREQLADPTLATIPVVVCTAELGGVEAHPTLRGVAGFLCKPAEPRHILDTVRRQCGPGRGEPWLLIEPTG
jgi:CheY-like chemotaxis protein